VTSRASHNSVLPLRGVAQMRYDAFGATTSARPARPSVPRTLCLLIFNSRQQKST
jgi:hypothetical protein